MDLTGQAYNVTHRAEHLVDRLAGCGVPFHVYEAAAKLAKDARTVADEIKAVSPVSPTGPAPIGPTPAPSPGPTPIPGSVPGLTPVPAGPPAPAAS
jgi:hypothetical protein